LWIGFHLPRELTSDASDVKQGEKQGGHAGCGKSTGQGIVKNPSQEEESPLDYISINDRII